MTGFIKYIPIPMNIARYISVIYENLKLGFTTILMDYDLTVTVGEMTT